MAKYTGPTCRLARREGIDLMLKSKLRSLESKCNMEMVPGQKAARRDRSPIERMERRAANRDILRWCSNRS